MTATSVLAKGEMLGGYRIEDIIGVGGMAIVYRAEQLSLGRAVALKVLAPQLSQDEAFRERFRREGKSVALLDHPHVLTVHDSGEIGGRLFLAMRLVDGETLAERMLTDGLSADDTLGLLSPIADALDAAHGAGLIHRDVKPQNILIGSNGHPYLADFGVATAGSATLGLTGTGGFVGSVNYAAPEQIRGQKTTPAGDVYALTAVLYQCVTGQVPYPRDTDVGIMHAHLHDPPPALAVLRPEAEALNDVIRRGMAKDPLARFQSAGELLQAASSTLATLSSEGRRAVPTFAAAPSALDEDAAAEDPRYEAGRGHVAAVPPRAAAVPTGPRPASRGTEIVPAAERRVRRRHVDATSADRRRTPAPIEPTAAPTRRPAPAAVVAAIVVLVALVGLAVVVFTRGGTGGVPLKTARGGPLTLAYPSPWRASSAPSTGSFALRPAAILLGTGRSSFAAGELARSAAVPGGVPPSLVARYGQPTSTTSAAAGGGPGRGYVWKLTNGQQLVAGIVPTANDDLAILCSAPASAAADLSTCTALAAGVKVSGVRVVPPGPDSGLTAALAGGLNAVVAARSRLAGLDASTLESRAPTAARVARQERAAAASVVRRAPPPRNRTAVTGLVTAVDTESAAWAVLAKAAATGDREAYARARTRIVAAGRRLRGAEAALAAQGFALPRLGVVVPAGPPPAPTAASPTITPPSSAGAGTSPAAPTGNPSGSNSNALIPANHLH